MLRAGRRERCGRLGVLARSSFRAVPQPAIRGRDTPDHAARLCHHPPFTTSLVLRQIECFSMKTSALGLRRAYPVAVAMSQTAPKLSEEDGACCRAKARLPLSQFPKGLAATAKAADRQVRPMTQLQGEHARALRCLGKRWLKVLWRICRTIPPIRRPSTSRPSNNMARRSGRPCKTNPPNASFLVNNFYEEGNCNTENSTNHVLSVRGSGFKVQRPPSAILHLRYARRANAHQQIRLRHCRAMIICEFHQLPRINNWLKEPGKARPSSWQQ